VDPPGDGLDHEGERIAQAMRLHRARHAGLGREEGVVGGAAAVVVEAQQLAERQREVLRLRAVGVVADVDTLPAASLARARSTCWPER